MLESFRRDCVKLMGVLLELETAVLDGKTDVAQATLKKVTNMRDEAHTRYGVEEHEEEPAAPNAAPGAGR